MKNENINSTAAFEENAPAPHRGNTHKVRNQPFRYPLEHSFEEPDWTRIPGYGSVSREDWESVLWQRRNTIKSISELRSVLGEKSPEDLLEDIEEDQKERANMSILLPPHMLNCMDIENLRTDPIRRYMLPALTDRHPKWPNHPRASRDSLHEAEMWAVEGLTHRYPTKVLAELLSTCPQYCGHCTRMDLVGNDVAKIEKKRFESKPKERYAKILEYLRQTPAVRDVVVSGGDIANLPTKQLEDFVEALLDMRHIRDIRLATKGLIGLPQHFLQDDVLKTLERLAKRARKQGVQIALHTHANHASQITPLVARAASKLLDTGIRDIRNQGVLMRDVNDSAESLLQLCFRLLDDAAIMPYYFYLCDMVPNSEHWRLSLFEAQRLQHDIMGYLPGFATPRLCCDVPLVGKRWVDQCAEYDRDKGISYWTKNYVTTVDADDPDALDRRYEYYDPVYTLPETGQEYWRKNET